MSDPPLLHLLRGPFGFLDPTLAELRTVMPDWAEVLPRPQKIFLKREEATPVRGFPILLSAGTQSLRQTLEKYLRAEEEAESEIFRGRKPTRGPCESAWEEYRVLLARMTQNAVSSSFGRHYPSIFWLYHSIAVSRVFKETPLRLRRSDLAIGKAHGDEIKYRVFERYLDRILSVTYDVVQRAARETEEEEKELFPALLGRMRDNVLILTEDHISPDLAELDSYLRGSLRLDGKEFRDRYQMLVEWHARELGQDPELEAAVRHLLGTDRLDRPAALLLRPGYVTFLTRRPSYDPGGLFGPELVRVWERLLLKLKEYELLVAMRRAVIPVRQQEEGLECSAATVGLGLTGKTVVQLSASTRPLDFTTPWVVDPQVQRYGLVYDITDFSAIISALRRSGTRAQDDSIRKIFGFQRRVNRMARDYRLQLEKYLGDGAMYSGRFPTRLLGAAIRIQRYYRQALEAGFPFDRGLRIALNYGQYRLLPIEGGGGVGGHRYEFFGHGIVELTRLVTGKTMHELEDIRTLLVSRGYSAEEVDRFFAPVAHRSIYLVDKLEEARPFHAYVNASGVLVNEGIVATDTFIEQLDRERVVTRIYRAREGRRSYIAFDFEEGDRELRVGIRKLGLAALKGLGRLPVFEVVDGGAWRQADLERLPGTVLLEPLDRDFRLAAETGVRPSGGV